MKPEYKLEDKLGYYSYTLCYVDDILCIHHDPDNVWNKLNDYVLLKPGTFGSFDMYLDMIIKFMQLQNGIGARGGTEILTKKTSPQTLFFC